MSSTAVSANGAHVVAKNASIGTTINKATIGAAHLTGIDTGPVRGYRTTGPEGFRTGLTICSGRHLL